MDPTKQGEHPMVETEQQRAQARSERKMNLGTTVILLVLFFGLLGFGLFSCMRIMNQSHFI